MPNIPPSPRHSIFATTSFLLKSSRAKSRRFGGSRANANSRDRKFVVKHAEARFRALQTSECNELLDPARASCMILAQRQPGKNTRLRGKKLKFMAHIRNNVPHSDIRKHVRIRKNRKKQNMKCTRTHQLGLVQVGVLSCDRVGERVAVEVA